MIIVKIILPPVVIDKFSIGDVGFKLSTYISKKNVEKE